MLVLIISITSCSKNSTSPDVTAVSPASTYTGSGSITQGLGVTTNTAIYSCSGGRVTNLGSITSKDNKT